jgi:hypothetical protein
MASDGISIRVGNSSWWVFAKAGKDGRLMVFVSHEGQPEVIARSHDLGVYGEWAGCFERGGGR